MTPFGSCSCTRQAVALLLLVRYEALCSFFDPATVVKGLEVRFRHSFVMLVSTLKKTHEGDVISAQSLTCRVLNATVCGDSFDDLVALSNGDSENKLVSCSCGVWLCRFHLAAVRYRARHCASLEEPPGDVYRRAACSEARAL